jgi:NADH:ubiquinone oxidoreductase subunit F (NADH-binding)
MTSTPILATPARFPRLMLPAAPASDPLDLDAAVTAGAFTALRIAVEQLKPEGVINALIESGMRGRGGGGRQIGEKWYSCAQWRRLLVVQSWASTSLSRPPGTSSSTRTARIRP